LDHIIVSGETHLRRILVSYAAYYNGQRPHSARWAISPRQLMPPISPQRAIGCATRTSSADRTLLYPRRTA
jgi:hypothetical protein